MAVTAAEVDGIEISNWQTAMEETLSYIRGGGPKAVILKVEDRIDNLEQPVYMKQQERKIRQTAEFYMPVFELLVDSDYNPSYKRKDAAKRLNRLKEIIDQAA